MSDCEFCAHYIFQIAHERSGKCSCLMKFGSRNAGSGFYCLSNCHLFFEEVKDGLGPSTGQKPEENIPRNK